MTETTKEELERLRAENADLREQLAGAQENQIPQPNTRPVATRPSFGLSEGERADLAERGVTNSAFTGEVLTATGEGVETTNPDAKKADERAEAKAAEDAPAEQSP